MRQGRDWGRESKRDEIVVVREKTTISRNPSPCRGGVPGTLTTRIWRSIATQGKRVVEVESRVDSEIVSWRKE